MFWSTLPNHIKAGCRTHQKEAKLITLLLLPHITCVISCVFLVLGLLVYTLAIITMYFLFWNIFSFLVVPCHSFLPCSQMFFPFFPVFSQMSYIYLSISCVIASQIHFEQNKTVLFMWQFSLHGYTRKSYNELIESNSDVHELKFHQSKFTKIIYNHQQLHPSYVILSHFT